MVVCNFINLTLNTIWIIWYININYINENFFKRNIISLLILIMFVGSYLIAKNYFN